MNRIGMKKTIPLIISLKKLEKLIPISLKVWLYFLNRIYIGINWKNAFINPRTNLNISLFMLFEAMVVDEITCFTM